MPRGQRKHGQFDFTIWYPDGSRFQVKSTKDLATDQWCADTTEYLTMLQRAVTLSVAKGKVVTYTNGDTGNPTKDAGRGVGQRD